MNPRVDRWLWARSTPQAVLHSLLGLVLIGLADWWTGPWISFSIFYAIPVFGMTWRLGRRQGFWMALYSASVWGIVDRINLPEASSWVPLWNFVVGFSLLAAFALIIAVIKEEMNRQEALTTELQEALAEVRRLTGLLRMCAWCRRIRNDQGEWEPFEAYVLAHADVDISHGICPECAAKYHSKKSLPDQ